MGFGEFEAGLSHLSSKIISVPVPENLSVEIPQFPLPFAYLDYELKRKERHNKKIRKDKNLLFQVI